MAFQEGVPQLAFLQVLAFASLAPVQSPLLTHRPGILVYSILCTQIHLLKINIVYPQNTTTVLCLRYTRMSTKRKHSEEVAAAEMWLHNQTLSVPYYQQQTDHNEKSAQYVGSTLVLTMELIKVSLVLSLFMLVEMRGSVCKGVHLLYKEVVCRPSDTLLLAIPSGIYIVQDNLIIYALLCLDAATYQVLLLK